MNNKDNTYRKLVEFEEKAARIYLTMAAHFKPENPELCAFWTEMSMQEKQHSSIVEFCRFEKLFAESAPTDEQLRSLSDVFAGLTQRASDPTLAVEEAFRIAVEMETSELNDIYDNLTNPMNSTLYLARKKIEASAPDHAGQLLKEAHKHHLREGVLADLAAAANRANRPH